MPFRLLIWAWGYRNPHPRELVRGWAERPETCCQILTGHPARRVLLPVVGAARGRPRRGSRDGLQAESLERQPGDRPPVRRVDLIAVDPRVHQLDPDVLI